VPFGMVSGVDRKMGTLDAVGDRRWGRRSFRVNLGRPIVTSENGDALSPNYFGGRGLVDDLYCVGCRC